MEEYIIGRSGNQAFKIPDDKDGVSNRHALLTITDDGRWILEDLKGMDGNGTYVLQDNGEWKRILKCPITPHTKIRLARFHSFTFMAYRVKADNPMDFSYEFSRLRQQWKYYSDLIAKEEKRIKKRKLTVNGIAVTGILSGVILSMIEPIVGIGMGVFSGGSMVMRMIFAPDNEKLNKLYKTRQQNAKCPNCGRPLSETDISDMSCSACHAH